MSTQTPAEFFFANAGYSYVPEIEGPIAGRVICALDLAFAEWRAADEGYSFEWSIDPYMDSSDWSDEEPHEVWECFMHDAEGAVVGSLGGVDLGAGGHPDLEPHARVVQAELAYEHLPERTREAEVILFLSDARGIYIPRDFARSVDRDQVNGVSEEDWEILEAGPDHELYWDAWSDVCDNARVTEPTTGVVYTVYQDGDCWLIEDGAELDEAGEQGWIVKL